jgi:succinate-semialdehyde dehydrogenase/glutarate-semialdehyde dehydrogenase
MTTTPPHPPIDNETIAALLPPAWGRPTFTVKDPATGLPICDVPDHDVADGLAAVERADKALPAWAGMAPRERAEILRRAFDLMISDTSLAPLIAWENGKSIADARAEVTYAAEFFRWFAEEAVRLEGQFSIAPAGGTRTLVTHRPVGVAALITPWNFPAAMATRKIAPALAAGCTMVLKPASETPLTALAIARILTAAGVPDGVLEVVPTSDAGGVVGAWLADDRVRKVSFTGSTNIGRHLLRQAADRVLNASMELGGNAPFIVCPDADIDAAVAGAMVAKFRGGGQACTAANRLYVHADVAEKFIAAFGTEVESLRVGAGRDEKTQVGPMISAQAVRRLDAQVEDAVAAGARISHRATIPTTGSFYPPTVLTDVPADAAILKEELFGPVAPIVTWTDEDDLVARANDTEFGLAAYVYAGSLKTALQLAERIEAGMIGINRGVVSDPAAPFGGVKQSGLGREGAHEGIQEFCEIQYFSVDWS